MSTLPCLGSWTFPSRSRPFHQENNTERIVEPLVDWKRIFFLFEATCGLEKDILLVTRHIKREDEMQAALARPERFGVFPRGSKCEVERGVDVSTDGALACYVMVPRRLGVDTSLRLSVIAACFQSEEISSLSNA